MSRRSSSLNNYTGTGITREIDSRYDDVKIVADNIDDIVLAADTDWDALIASLEEAKDFTGIVVETTDVGNPASWDPVTKVLTVPVQKGDTGSTGAAGDNGKTPLYDFSVDYYGNLQYELIGYTSDEGLPNPVEEW